MEVYEDLRGFPLNQQLRLLRYRRELTQGELAKEIKTTKVSISEWENGKRIPVGRTIERIRQYYGLPIGFLTIDETEEQLLN